MSPSPPDVVLRATGLVKRWGTLVAVDHLSLDLHRGEILGFLGPNGAGKTTTLRMLYGFLRPDAGTVEIFGQRLVPGARDFARRVGVTPQDVVIWESLTCLEQLQVMGQLYDLAAATARTRALDLLEDFGLSDKRHAQGRTLSGGMRRRLSIALALVHRPEILFLDEPQAGLDPQSRVLVRDYIRSLAGRGSGALTVVITTHDMDEAEKLADRVCIVDRGRLLVQDTVEAIQRQVGDGDLFELTVTGDTAALVPHLPPAVGAVTCRDGTLSFSSVQGTALLPEVLAAVQGRGHRVEQVRVRKRTLEDAFIHLTGRGLRE